MVIGEGAVDGMVGFSFIHQRQEVAFDQLGILDGAVGDFSVERTVAGGVDLDGGDVHMRLLPDTLGVVAGAGADFEDIALAAFR